MVSIPYWVRRFLYTLSEFLSFLFLYAHNLVYILKNTVIVF